MALTVVEARTLLARAFVDDPLMVWFFPDDDSRLHACAAVLGLFAEHYLSDGRVDHLNAVSGDRPEAVAMWRWPGPGEALQPETLPTTSGLMYALLGAPRGGEVRAAMSVVSELRPPEPYAYLHLLAVDPDLQRRGLGSRVLALGLAAAREAGLAACLETMNPANVPFYESHGFSVRAQVQLGAGGPTVWEMTAAPY